MTFFCKNYLHKYKMNIMMTTLMVVARLRPFLSFRDGVGCTWTKQLKLKQNMFFISNDVATFLKFCMSKWKSSWTVLTQWVLMRKVARLNVVYKDKTNKNKKKHVLRTCFFFKWVTKHLWWHWLHRVLSC